MLKLNFSEDGFTLVELLVSIIVGALLLTSINTIYTNQLLLNQLARDTFVANSYVEGKIESLRSLGYLGLSNGTSNITSELPAELSPPKSATQTVSTESTSIKRVVLDVTYNKQGTTQTFSYTTYVGELGVGQY